MQRNGKAMPGHVKAVNGAVVTVSFDVSDLVLPVVQMPVLGSEYFRIPIQVGDKGGCMPFDFYMGAVSGLGSSKKADSSQQGNLSTLVWVPVGSKNWSAVDPSKATVYGPHGATIRDQSNTLSIDLDAPSNTISITAGGHTLSIGPAGIVLDGIVWGTHEHTSGTYVAGSTPVTLKSGGPTGP